MMPAPPIPQCSSSCSPPPNSPCPSQCSQQCCDASQKPPMMLAIPPGMAPPKQRMCTSLCQQQPADNCPTSCPQSCCAASRNAIMGAGPSSPGSPVLGYRQIVISVPVMAGQQGAGLNFGGQLLSMNQPMTSSFIQAPSFTLQSMQSSGLMRPVQTGLMRSAVSHPTAVAANPAIAGTNLVNQKTAGSMIKKYIKLRYPVSASSILKPVYRTHIATPAEIIAEKANQVTGQFVKRGKLEKVVHKKKSQKKQKKAKKQH